MDVQQIIQYTLIGESTSEEFTPFGFIQPLQQHNVVAMSNFIAGAIQEQQTQPISILTHFIPNQLKIQSYLMNKVPDSYQLLFTAIQQLFSNQINMPICQSSKLQNLVNEFENFPVMGNQRNITQSIKQYLQIINEPILQKFEDFQLKLVIFSGLDNQLIEVCRSRDKIVLFLKQNGIKI